MWWAGQSQGLIEEIDTCANIVARIMADAEQLMIERLPRLLDR